MIKAVFDCDVKYIFQAPIAIKTYLFNLGN